MERTPVTSIQKIVIAGGGTAGWMAAALLSKTFSSALDIELVESEQIGTIGVGEATIPPLRLFNETLGIDEDDFLANTGGTFKLGIQFEGWGSPNDCYMHSFGEIGLDLGLGKFYQYWLRSRREGNQHRLWDYDLNEIAARRNRFDRFEKVAGTPMQGPVHAYHLDAGLYAAYLRTFSEARGVRRTEGRIVSVRRDANSGHVESLELEDGQVLAGDFFIDCTGFRRLIIGQALGVPFEDWTHWLPCDRAMAVPCAPVQPLIPYTRAIAREAGWQWRIPLQHRLGNGHVYCSAHMSDDEAASILLSNLDGETSEDPRPLRFTTGRCREFWHKNCLAIGLAGGFMEPLESTSIHLIQNCISRFVRHFPSSRNDDVTAEHYNRESLFEFDRIRDFIILHYAANQREGSEFWDACRHMELPEALAYRMKLFRQGAQVYREMGELFTEPSWVQVLVGQNLEPETYHRLADSISLEQLQGYMRDVQTIVVTAVKKMPEHADFIRAHCQASFAEIS